MRRIVETCGVETAAKRDGEYRVTEEARRRAGVGGKPCILAGTEIGMRRGGKELERGCP
jgi:hypothetical protein